MGWPFSQGKGMVVPNGSGKGPGGGWSRSPRVPAWLTEGCEGPRVAAEPLRWLLPLWEPG